MEKPEILNYGNPIVGSAPYYINWNYTYACNLSCTHCYSRSPEYPKDLPTENYVDIAHQIVNNNVFAVGFGGGEPTSRSDLIRILSILATGGVYTHLTTNGAFLTKEYINKLKGAGVGSILVSIDSHDKATNDKIRNHDGAFDISCKAAETCATLGIKTMIACVATKINYNRIAEIESLASQLGVHGINFKIFRASGGAVHSKDLYELSQDQKRELENQLLQIKRTSKLEIESYQDTIGAGCSCGLTQLTIRPNGDVSICPYSSDVLGNLIEESLAHIWLSSPELKNRRQGGSTCISTSSISYPYNPSIPLTHKRL
jgi:MoaA/NifB/PqqE/SkfB family radical SAM enzyme